MKYCIVATFLLGLPLFAGDGFSFGVADARLSAPGEMKMVLEMNRFIDGRKTASFRGEMIPHHRNHVVVSLARGMTEYWDLTASIRMAAANSSANFGGATLSNRLNVLSQGPFVFGVNVDFGVVPSEFQEDPLGVALGPNIAYENENWYAAINLNFGWAVAPGADFVPGFEPCTRVAYQLRSGLTFGTEYYTTLGTLTAILPFDDQEHLLFLTGDIPFEDFGLHLGVGRGLTAASPGWVAKMALETAL